MGQDGQYLKKELVIDSIIKGYFVEAFDITDTENVKFLAEMIAAESAGTTDVEIEPHDIELAVIAASYIKQLVITSQTGCIIRGKHSSKRVA